MKEVVLDWGEVFGATCECEACVGTLVVSTFVLMTEHADLPVRMCGMSLCNVAERGLSPTGYLSETQLRQVLDAYDWLRDNRRFLLNLSRDIAHA